MRELRVGEISGGSDVARATQRGCRETRITRPVSAVDWASEYLVIGIGTWVIATSLAELAYGMVPSPWVILAALTLIAGVFTTRIEPLRVTVSVSDALALALALLFGSAAAIATVAADGLIAASRLKCWSVRRTLLSVTGPAISVWAAVKIFAGVSGLRPPLLGEAASLLSLMVPLLALATTYFVARTLLGAVAAYLDSESSVVEYLGGLWTELVVNYAATVVLLVSLMKHAGNVGTLSIAAGGIVVGLIALSHTFSRARIAHVESANRHLVAAKEMYSATVATLASAIDAKDQVTSGHIRRVQQSAVRLAADLGVDEPDEIVALECAALLHDLGKLVVPEHILNKPGALSQAEYEQMKRHASVGADILSNVKFPFPVEPIVRHHHENWDGTGYPDGLAGEAIPLGARILAVVDCFDALTSDRPYRARLSRNVALDIIQERRGTWYDPQIVDSFLKVYPELQVAQERASTRTHGSEQESEAELVVAASGLGEPVPAG